MAACNNFSFSFTVSSPELNSSSKSEVSTTQHVLKIWQLMSVRKGETTKYIPKYLENIRTLMLIVMIVITTTMTAILLLMMMMMMMMIRPQKAIE